MKAEDRYNSLFAFYGETNGLDPRLLKAQVRAESNFDPDAKSWAGAKGLAQFMDATWREWRDGKLGIQESPPRRHFDQYDPEDSIRAQAAMMAWLIRKLGGDLRAALAAYNWGIGRVLKDVTGWEVYAPRETREYVKKIIESVDKEKVS